MPTSKQHCSLNYHAFGSTDLDTFAHLVSEGIYSNNPPFTAPPLTQAAFDALVGLHHDKYEAYKNGGAAQKGAYITAKNNLITALDSTADFVDGLSGVNEAMILLAGYTPTKTGDTKAVVPAAPVVEKINRVVKGTLNPVCKTSSGAESYGCLLLDKPTTDGIIFIDGMLIVNEDFKGEFRHIVTKGRSKTFTNLKSGTEYWFFFYATNSAGVSGLGAGLSEVCG